MSEFYQDFQLDHGILHVRLSGTYPRDLLAQGTNAFQPLIDACAAQNCNKALVDARDLSVQFNTVELYQLGKQAAAMSHLGLRVALVAREDMRDRFFDDVVQNSGGKIGIFTSMDAALAWVQTQPQPVSPSPTQHPAPLPVA
jgi:hypothetical protein